MTTPAAPATETREPVYLALGHLAADGDEGSREFTGIAVPYDEDMHRPNWLTGASRQRFAAGSARFLDVTIVYYGHDHLALGVPIGKITAIEDTPEGPKVTGVLSRTPKGDEIYTLLRDGVLSKMSIGYVEVAWHMEEEGALQVNDEIEVFEVSIVPRPQYDSAEISSVLSRSTNPERNSPTMTETLVKPEEITALSVAQESLTESVETLSRQVATLGDITAQGSPGRDSGFLSYGEFLKAIAAEDPAAIEFLAFVGATTGDLGDHITDAWVGDLLRELTVKRRVISFFGTSPLPAEGMGVEYGLVKPTADTTQVAKQVAQGDVLAYGKVEFGTDRAPLETYGGWTDWARQVVDRAGAAVVEKFFRALYRRYMQATEAAVRTTAMAEAAATEVGTGAVDLATPEGWIDFAVDSTVFLDERGLTLDGFLVDPTTFKSLGKMRVGAEGDFFLDRNSGALNLAGLSADVMNVPVLLVPNATPGTVRGASTEAVDVWEDGRAPFRLQDDDITNLTQAMSIYGYMAHAVTDEEAITRPNDGL